MNTEEAWRPIPNEPGYEVSSFGRIRSLKRIVPRGRFFIACGGRILATHLNQQGRAIVRISRREVAHPEWPRPTYIIARLVAQAFVPNPENKREVNHIDGNRLNNRSDNLEWTTKEENLRHAYAIGLLRGRMLSHDTVRAIRTALAQPARDSLEKIAARFGTSRGTVARIKHGVAWKHVMPLPDSSHELTQPLVTADSSF